MCDIGTSRKIVVLILVFLVKRLDAQLDLPQYQPNAGNYPQNPSFSPNPNYSPINPYSIPITVTATYPKDSSQSRPVEEPRYDNNIPNMSKAYRGDIRGLLQALDVQASQQCTNNVAAQWNFETNVNQATQLEALQAQQVYSEFQHEVWDLLNHVGNVDNIRDARTYRQIRYYSVIGPAALPPDQLDRYNRLINDMLAIYNTASICGFNDHFHCGLRLQPDITKIMKNSRNWDELQHVWTEWRRQTGKKMKDLYEQMIHLSNAAAKSNNFTNTADYWSFPFESPALEIDLEDAWGEIKPLYELLHAYVRRRLREYYGPERIHRQAPLPSHILGNMWAQSWSNVFDITQPYPGQHFLDVTPEMVRQGYTPIDMFRLAEDFFVSLNMSAMPLDFWQGSVFEEPADRVVLCTPSAWDFCNMHDFRIKMCTNVNMKDLITAHHEMAHIHYFMAYKNQPKVFRDGANPAFHEAIGEAIGMSVGTPKHLQALGLVQVSVDDTAVDINYLYKMALEKLAFLPFALVMDKWRYDIFNGKIGKDEYNCHWHILREQYQGIKPPVLRSEIDFDPGSKYHIPANIPYLRFPLNPEEINLWFSIVGFEKDEKLTKCPERSNRFDPTDIVTVPSGRRFIRPGAKAQLQSSWNFHLGIRYFVSTILQFQIYRALCQAAGQYTPGDFSKPLHKCDIYRSKEAGNILKQLMEKGSSQSWRDVLFQATGESRLDGSALREYFGPLEDWLRNENLRTGEYVGWLYDGDYCKQSIETAGLQVYGGFYNSSVNLYSNFIILLVCFFIIVKFR